MDSDRLQFPFGSCDSNEFSLPGLSNNIILDIDQLVNSPDDPDLSYIYNYKDRRRDEEIDNSPLDTRSHINDNVSMNGIEQENSG